jgi:hypothetical protein
METLEKDFTANESKQRLVSFIKYLKSKKLFIVLMAIVGLSLGLIYSFIKKPVYTAAITFSLQEENKMGGGGLLSLASSFGLGMGGETGLFSGDNIEQVFKSRKIIEEALVQPYSGTNKTFGDFYLDILGTRKKLNLPQPFIVNNNQGKSVRQQDSIINEIYKMLNTGYMDVSKPDKKYDIYEITFRCTDENFSKYFVQELVKQVAIFYTDTKTKKAKQNVDVLQNRVDSIRNKIGSLMYQKASRADANLNPIFQTGKVPEQIKQVDMTAFGAGYGELLKNLELSRYALLKETPLFQIIDEPKFPLKKKTFSPILYSILGAFVFSIFAVGLLIMLKLYSNFCKMLKD